MNSPRPAKSSVQYTFFEISFSSNLSLYIPFDGLQDTLFGFLVLHESHNNPIGLAYLFWLDVLKSQPHNKSMSRNCNRKPNKPRSFNLRKLKSDSISCFCTSVFA